MSLAQRRPRSFLPLAAILPAMASAFVLATVPAHADNLSAALADAYNGNAVIQAGRYNLRATDEKLPQALAGWRPTVELQGSVTRNRQYLNFLPPPHEIFTQSNASLTITQPLWRGGSTVADVAAAAAQVNAGEADLESTQQTQLLRAADAYLDAYRDQSDVQLSHHLEGVLHVNLDNVNSTFQAGAATETDTSQAQARLSGAAAARLAAEGRLATSIAAFRTEVGRDPGTLDTPVVLGTIPASLADAESTALGANPSIASAKQRVAADKAEVRSLLGQLLPQVSAIAEWQNVDNYLAEHIRLDGLLVGIQASVPLYAAGTNYSQIRAARDRWEADDKMEIEAERQVRQQVDSAWNELAAAKAEQHSYGDQIHANQIALNDTQKEVTVGTRTRLDTLNAEQELFQSQVDLVGADHDTLAASFALEAAIGGFTPQALGLDVASYDPATYRNKERKAWIGTQPPQ